MSHHHLLRDDAPFGSTVWSRVDEAVLGAAKAQMSARRLLHIDGPYGLGLKTVPGPEAPAGKPDVEGVTLSAAAGVPVAEILASFSLPARDIAAFETSGLPIDLAPAAQAGAACARQEDALIFGGSKALGAPGLLSAKGTQTARLKAWTEPGAAAENLIDALTKLDAAGCHGPYSLALGPELYNLLFRRYNQGNQTEIDHVRTFVTDGIVKAPALGDSGVLLASGRQYASIVVGQDLSVGFTGPADGSYEFFVSETLALRLAVPDAVCVLKKK